jgi:hypothetical protein
MSTKLALISVWLAFAGAGCSTSQQVTIAKADFNRTLKTVAQVPDADNSAQMNGYLESALQKEGLALKAPLPAGTRKADDVDALVSYVDVWRWDLAMYMQSLTVRVHDASNGDLLATGRWHDSPLHGFRNAKAVMEGLVAEVFAKLRGTAPPK